MKRKRGIVRLIPMKSKPRLLVIRELPNEIYEVTIQMGPRRKKLVVTRDQKELIEKGGLEAYFKSRKD